MKGVARFRAALHFVAEIAAKLHQIDRGLAQFVASDAHLGNGEWRLRLRTGSCTTPRASMFGEHVAKAFAHAQLALIEPASSLSRP